MNDSDWRRQAAESVILHAVDTVAVTKNVDFREAVCGFVRRPASLSELNQAAKLGGPELNREVWCYTRLAVEEVLGEIGLFFPGVRTPMWEVLFPRCTDVKVTNEQLIGVLVAKYRQDVLKIAKRERPTLSVVPTTGDEA